MKYLYKLIIIMILIMAVMLFSSCDYNMFNAVFSDYIDYFSEYFPNDGSVYDYEFLDSKELNLNIGTNLDFNETTKFYKDFFEDKDIIIISETMTENSFDANGKSDDFIFDIAITPFENPNNSNLNYKTNIFINVSFVGSFDDNIGELYPNSYIEISESSDKKSIEFKFNNHSLKVSDEDYLLSLYINGEFFKQKESDEFYISKSTFLDMQKNIYVSAANASGETIASAVIEDFIVFDTRYSNIESMSETFKTAKSIAVYGRKFDNVSPLLSIINPEKFTLGINSFKGTIGLDSMTNLSDLTLLDGRKRDLEFLSKQESLTNLNIWVKDLSSISSLKNLKHLSLYGTKNLSGLENLKNLETLSLDNCTASNLSYILKIPNLKSLEIKNCERTIDFVSIANHRKIESLSFSDCKILKGLDESPEFKSVKSLSVFNCRGISSLSFLLSFHSLERLDIRDFKYISDLSPLTELANLECLHIDGLSNVEDLLPLITLNSLKHLSIDSDKDLFPISSISSLEILRLNNTNNISYLSSLVNLKHITVNGTNEFSSLSKLENLKSFKSSTVMSGADLKSIPKSITSLDLSSNKNLEDLSFLKDFNNLEHLNISDCRKIKDLSSLSTLTNLKSLDISDCTSISDISPLSDITGLKSLNMQGCLRVWTIAPLAELKNLIELNIAKCDRVKNYSHIEKLNLLSFIK